MHGNMQRDISKILISHHFIRYILQVKKPVCNIQTQGGKQSETRGDLGTTCTCRQQTPSYLKFEFRAAEVGSLFLPEVVRLDDEGDVDAGRERLLQYLQQRLDAVPLGAAHVNDDREAMFTHLLTGMDGGRREWEELKRTGGRWAATDWREYNPERDGRQMTGKG